MVAALRQAVRRLRSKARRAIVPTFRPLHNNEMPAVEEESSSRLFTLFRVAVLGCAAVALLGLFWPAALEEGALTLTTTIFGALDWFYMASVSAFLLLGIYMAFGPYGDLKLGQPDDEPEFSTMSWLAMLFAAGMGSGLIFWGVAEPMSHFASPPVGDPLTAESARQAMVLANFHWGFHAWVIYGIAAMVLAYFGFRKQTPYLPGAPIRDAFTGRWVEPVARLADFVAVLAVAFGVAGSLGLGIQQIHTGLHLITGIPADSTVVAMGILVFIAISYMISAATSLDKGIKWLSNINMTLCVSLMLFVLFVGPTDFLFRTFFTALGDYLSGLVALSLRLYPYEDVGQWFQAWTLTYIIWWIAWAPFVGVFIARISRGRTIREFILGVVLSPTIFSVLWFAIFGGAAFEMENSGERAMAQLVQEDVTIALFALFDGLPLSTALAAVAAVLIFIFLVTSVDSATFVLSMMTSRGDMNPPRRQKLTWGIVLGAMGGALLLTDNYNSLRAVAVSGAIPFTFILLLQIAGFLRELRKENLGGG